MSKTKTLPKVKTHVFISFSLYSYSELIERTKKSSIGGPSPTDTGFKKQKKLIITIIYCEMSGARISEKSCFKIGVSLGTFEFILHLKNKETFDL